MAVRTPTITPSITAGDNCIYVRWTGLLNGDTGAPFENPGYSDRTVQVTGTFGTGGSVNIEGSIVGTTYVVLTDPQGNAITKTSAAIEAVTEVVRYIRPNVTAGDGTTSLTCDMLFKRVK